MALREGDWKLVWNNVDKVPDGSPELYNLKDDPSETRDLASSSPDKVKKMKKEMLEQHSPSKEFPFTFDK